MLFYEFQNNQSQKKLNKNQMQNKNADRNKVWQCCLSFVYFDKYLIYVWNECLEDKEWSILTITQLIIDFYLHFWICVLSSVHSNGNTEIDIMDPMGL